MKALKKTKDKESPPYCIDIHPATFKSTDTSRRIFARTISSVNMSTSTSRGTFAREKSQVWTLSSPDERAAHERRDKIDETGMRAGKIGQTLTKWLTVVINDKLRE